MFVQRCKTWWRKKKRAKVIGERFFFWLYHLLKRVYFTVYYSNFYRLFIVTATFFTVFLSSVCHPLEKPTLLSHLLVGITITVFAFYASSFLVCLYVDCLPLPLALFTHHFTRLFTSIYSRVNFFFFSHSMNRYSTISIASINRFCVTTC